MGGLAENGNNLEQGQVDRVRWSSKLPLFTIKLICFALMMLAGYLCVVSDSFEDRVLHFGLAFTVAGVYTNLAYLKNSVKEIFEEPVRFYGYPIFFCATIFTIWYEYLTW